MKYQQVNSVVLEEACHVGELHVPPAALATLFGEPCAKAPNTESMGELYFRSASGDCFVVYVLDVADTLNDLEVSEHQFWSVTEPVPFCIGGKHESAVEDFKYWIHTQIKQHS